MSKELEALIRIEDLLSSLYETDVINDDHLHDTNIIGEALKRLEELEKAFVALSKDDEKAKKLLSIEIEKNRAFETLEALDIIVKKLKIKVEERIYLNDKEPHYFLKYDWCYSKEISKEKYLKLKEIGL